MFILYQDDVIILKDINGNVSYIRHGDIVDIFGGKYIINMSENHKSVSPTEITFRRTSFPYDTITSHDSSVYNIMNTNRIHNDDPMYESSGIAYNWLLYSPETRQYFKEGDELCISSHTKRFNERHVIFDKVLIEHDVTKVILRGDNGEEYELVNFRYNGTSAMVDIQNGIPFYTDIHCAKRFELF